MQGYTQLNKEHLLPALCKALGIDSHAHHAAAIAEKASVKASMRAINAEKAKALESGDRALLRQLRRHYHRLNHSLRAAAKHAPKSVTSGSTSAASRRRHGLVQLDEVAAGVREHWQS